MDAVVDVETAGELTRGWNLIDTLGRVEREPNARVVTDYDTEGFFELLLGCSHELSAADPRAARPRSTPRRR